jgi:hypothetical protein
LDKLGEKLGEENNRNSTSVTINKEPAKPVVTMNSEPVKSEYNRKSFRASVKVNDVKAIFEQNTPETSPTTSPNYRKSVLKPSGLNDPSRQNNSRVNFREGIHPNTSYLPLKDPPSTTVENVDLETGKIVKTRYTVYKLKEMEQFTELLSLPCILEVTPCGSYHFNVL